MLVQIEPAGPSGVPTWAMLELQGEIERTDGGSLDHAFDVGTLSITSSGAIQLHIGYHQLEGKRVELKKPYAVLDKVARPDGTPYFKVVGVVRDKLLFKARPRALITKPEGTKK